MHEIEIDPNVRVNGNHTYTYLSEEDVEALEVGAAYVVGESESGLVFPATLVEARPDGYVEFDVAWEKGSRVCFCLFEDGVIVRTDDLCPLHSKRPGVRKTDHVHDVSCAFGNPTCPAFAEPRPCVAKTGWLSGETYCATHGRSAGWPCSEGEKHE